MCLVLLAAVLLEPVSYARAEEEDAYSRTRGIPRLNSSEVLFNKKIFFDWFGFKNVPEENVIEEFELAHLKLEYVDYSLYELVCDFELSTMGSGEELIISTCSYTIDFEDYEKGVIDSILVYFNLKDDYYEHVFDYREIVQNAEGFEEYDVTGDGDYIYNTVITQADFYFVRKSDGEKGEARRFKFTWNSDFWMQICTKIDFSWYDHETEIQKDIGSVENDAGVDGYSSNTTGSFLNIDEFVWSDILWLLADVPASIVEIVVGFVGIISYIADLFKVVFPFIPGLLFDIFAVFILITIIVAVWKMIFGG